MLKSFQARFTFQSASLSCIVYLMLCLSACQQAIVAPSDTTIITIGGATSMHPVLHELTTAFSHQYPAVVFNVLGGGSTLGEEQVAKGEIDLAASTLYAAVGNGTTTSLNFSTERAPSNNSPATELLRTPIGLDGIALISHKSNAIENISTADVRELFRGRILNWQDLGGVDLEVQLISRENDSGARIQFESRLMSNDSVALTAVVMPTSKDVVAYVAKTPSAIGYVSRGYLTDWLRASENSSMMNSDSIYGSRQAADFANAQNVHVIALDNHRPTLDSLRQQTYPLIQPLYLISQQEPRDWTRAFLDFVLSPSGQAIVGQFHLPIRE